MQGLRALFVAWGQAVRDEQASKLPSSSSAGPQPSDSEATATEPVLKVWREEWGTAGELSKDAPYGTVLSDEAPGGTTGEPQTYRFLPDQPIPDTYQTLCSAVGGDSLIGLLAFDRSHEYAGWRVATPWVEPRHELDTDDQTISIKPPKEGYLTLVAYVMLGIMKEFMVCIPPRDCCLSWITAHGGCVQLHALVMCSCTNKWTLC